MTFTVPARLRAILGAVGTDASEYSRASQFAEAASSVRMPSFRTQQQGAGQVRQQDRGRYNNLSVLDNYLPSGIGSSASDKSRILADGTKLSSPNGKSEETYQKRQWLDSKYRTIG